MSPLPLRSLAHVGLLSLALTGCQWFGSSDDDDPQVREWSDDDVFPSEDDTDAPQAPLTAEALQVVGAPIGDEGAAPDRIVFSLARSVFPSTAVGGEPPDGTRVVVEPPVEGQLEVVSRSAVAFVPASGFAPKTDYALRLQAVGTGDEIVDVPEGEGEVELTTPTLTLLRARPTRTGAKDRRSKGLAFELVFSGPVDFDAARGALSVSHSAVGDVTRSGRLTAVPDRPNRLAFTIKGPITERAGTFITEAAAGYASATGGAKGAGGIASWEFDPSAGTVDVLNVRLVEGTRNFQVEVMCDDDKSEGYKRWRWVDDLGEGFRTSPRCLPDPDEVQEHIQLSPAVPFTVVQSAGGFRIQAPIQRGPLRVTLGAGLHTVDGGLLTQTDTHDFTVPMLSPSVSFTASGRYLPRGAWRSLAVQHRNVEELRVQVRHIPERNMVFWLTDSSEKATARVAHRIVDHRLPVRGAVDASETTWIDIERLVPDPSSGVYEVTISGGGASDARRLLLTDMNLVVKGGDPSGEGALRVWALDTHTGAQHGGVEVSAILPSGKAVSTCTTGADGCALDLSPDPLLDEPPVALLARRGSDLTYLKFDELKTDLSEHKVQGEPYAADTPYRASLWTERGVFRPGDTAHVAGVVRDADHVAPPRNMPVDIQVRDPRNQVVRTLAVRLNAAGMFEVDLPFADYARTGSYRVQARAGGKLLGELQFGVEEFVPERMSVDAHIAGEGYLDTAQVPVSTQARYLFGGSAAGHRYELRCTLRPTTFAPEQAKGFTFGQADGERKAVDLGMVTGELNEDGEGELKCPSPEKSARPAGASTLVADVAVFEAGSGRTTQRTATVPVHPAEHYVGLQVSTARVKAGEPFKVQGAVVDWKGEPVTGDQQVELELVQLDTEWGYTVDPDTGRERYGKVLRPVPLGKETVQVSGGRFTTSLTAQADAGRFRVVARMNGLTSAVEVEGTRRYWYWNDGEQDSDATPRPLKPTGIPLEAPTSLKVGESGTVTYTAPYKGHMLLTVETDEVLRSEWVRVDAGQGEWSFKVDDFVDNVYVSAMLIKDPHLESDEAYLPDRAFGVQSVRIEPTAFVGTIDLKAPAEIRSGSELSIDVDLGAGKGARYVTVAAVDEGILSLTDFPSPDPTPDLFPDRALGIKTWETVGWSLHLPASGASRSTGGDGEGALPGRVQMVKPVSLWSGLVEVPESGKTTVTFEVPQYRGRLRVMAVSGGLSKVAHADTTVTVRDPVVVQTTLPRNLVQGDQAEIPVFLTNVSGKARDVTVSLTAEQIESVGAQLGGTGLPPVRFEGAQEATFRLADGESHTAVFRVRTHIPAGALRFEAVATSEDLTVRETLEVPVESTGPRSRRSELIALDGGRLDLAATLQGWEPGTERSTVWVTNNPYGKSFAHLKHIVRYPYGCIEQTTSSTRPLLYVGDLLQAADPELAASSPIDDMVASGVDRLFSMQTPSGGFAYWQGGTTPTGWGTAYATHLLLDARDAGYEVPEQGLNDAIAWLASSIDSRSDLSDAHRGTPGGLAYVHYVLARAGQGNTAAMAQELADLSGATTGPQREAVYLLQAGLYLAGDRRYEAQLRKPDTSPITWERVNDWSFYSDLRRRAFQLSIYADLFGEEGADPLARRVADALAERRSGRYTTQELGWGISGLGKVLSQGSRDYKATLTAGGRALEPDSWGQGGASDVLSWSLVRASEIGDLALKVDKAGDGKLYAMVQSEGVRQGATWDFGGQGLSVTREYLTPEGRAVSLDNIELGDLVLSKVTVRNTSRSTVQNVALVDRIPAGFEIENARLGRGIAPDWLDEDRQWTLDNLNLRDDRVEAFGELQPNQQVEVTFTVRAVTAGTFTLPPVEVEAMYDPEMWARAKGSVVRIHGPWADFYL